MSAEDDDLRKSDLETFLNVGADITGAVAGASMGYLTAGPAGGLGGAMVGPVIGTVVKDFLQRRFSRREQARAGAALQFSLEVYVERIEANDQIRSDEFIRVREGRPAAEELLEGTLFAAQRDHEEKKTRFIGYFYGNLLFEEQVGSSLANWILRNLHELSWTELILLAMIGRKEELVLPDRVIGKDRDSDWDIWNLDRQLADLGPSHRLLIGAPSKKTERFALSYPNMDLIDQVLTSGGKLIYHMASLHKIDASDVDDLLLKLAIRDPTEETPK